MGVSRLTVMLSCLGVVVAATRPLGAQQVSCVLLALPEITITIPPASPAEPLRGNFTVQCPAGWRVRAELTTRGVLQGPLDLPYRLDQPVLAFTGTGHPQVIPFTGRITLAGAIGTMVMPAQYVDHPSVVLRY